MNGRAAVRQADRMVQPPEAAAILDALRSVILVVDEAGRITEANAAAEQFFDCGAVVLRSQTLTQVVPPDSPLLMLVEQARGGMPFPSTGSSWTPRARATVRSRSMPRRSRPRDRS